MTFSRVVGHRVELQCITDVYGNRKARRSGAPYINHIHEGLAILEALGASERAKKVFCLHPLKQEGISTEQFECHKAVLEFHEKNSLFRNSACHAFLKPNQVYEKLGEISDDVCYALLADKLQNRKDFMLYHFGTHPNTERLSHYFDTWIKCLNRKLRFNESESTL